MRLAIKIIYYSLSILLFIYSFYFLLMGIIGSFTKKKKNNELKENKIHRFAIVIPARNEQKVIQYLLDSLNKQNYPKESYEIYVAINNCTDNTEAICLENNVNIIPCGNDLTDKGQVLSYAFKYLESKDDIDAYVVFDADNIVDKDFLVKMNESLLKGYKVAQGNRQGKNHKDNWLSSSYTIFYLIQNSYFNQARVNLNASSSINGTGFMIKKELLDKDNFYTETLTEDLEFAGQCAINHIKIDYVEDAITYDEYTTKFKASWIQRTRWSKGVNSCLKRYYKPLTKDFLKTGNISSLDMSFVFLAPLMQLLDFVRFIVFILFAIFCTESILITLLINLGVSFIFYLITIIFEIVIIAKRKLPVRALFSGIIFFSLFIYSWTFINIVALFSRKKDWQPIDHNRDISIDERMK